MRNIRPTKAPNGLFISSDSRRKRTKEDCYPQGPLHRGMQLKIAETAIFRVLVSLAKPVP